MALKKWKCQKCKQETETFKNAPVHCELPMQLELEAPQAKFMEPRDKAKGKSVLKDQNKLLKERSRNHSRDQELDELITMNSKDLAVKNKWVNEDGRKRKKIDDI